MKQYIQLIKTIIKEGVEKTDRTGTGTISIFGHQSTYDVSKEFPLLTAKNTYQNGFIIELLWFIGTHMKDEKYSNLSRTNIKYLVDNNVNIWNEWPHKAMKDYQKKMTDMINEKYDGKFDVPPPLSLKDFKDKIKNDEKFADRWGNLGPVYGKQWRQWQGWISTTDVSSGKPTQGSLWFDQLLEAIHTLKTKPDDRGIIISAWNVSELKNMALRPCHTMFQLYTQPLSHNQRLQLYADMVTKRGGLDTDDFNTEEKLDFRGVPKYKLSLQLYQRSADVFLGVPFNVASYSLLLHMIAEVTNMVPDKFVHTFGDAHIYLNHKEQINKFLNRSFYGGDDKVPSDFIDFWKYPSNLEDIEEQCVWPSLPTLKLNPKIKDIEDFTREDIEIVNYKPWSKIDAPVAV